LEHSDYKYLPWHDIQWKQIWSQERVPQALLLTGPAGIGKSAFARAIAARLLCSDPQSEGACGNCPACHWLTQGNHPDIRLVVPEADAEGAATATEGEKKKGSVHIVIDQIRALSDFVFVGAHRGGAKVVVIDPASSMNAAAANAVLKILEEPPPSVYFILVTRNQTDLLATVRSRCRVLKLQKPSASQATEWLRRESDASAADLLDFVGGAPLAAAAATGNFGRTLNALLSSFAQPEASPLELASRWEKLLQGSDEGGLRMEDLVLALQKWIYALVLLRVANRQRFLGKMSALAEGQARKAATSQLLRCYNDLLKIRALASHPLNTRLMLEDMAERYLRALANERR
jgi:DNA polymerase III subunit delta'